MRRSFAASKLEKKALKLAAKLTSATQNAIGYALALLLDTNPEDDDDVPKLTIKKVFNGLLHVVRNSAASMVRQSDV